MSSLYLDETIGEGTVSIGDELAIEGADARHAVTVNRVRVGESVAIGNGRGLIAWGVVLSAIPSRLSIEVEMVSETAEAEPQLWLVQALAKGDRDELAIQAATELGVAGVVPWQAARSVSRWDGPKVDRGIQRWTTIVREASKQAIRPTVPAVDGLVSTKQLAAIAAGHLMILLDPTADSRLGDLELPSEGRVMLVVGPEGGIAPEEIDVLVAAGAVRARLGATVLRTSTAGPAALAVLNARLGRW